MEQISYEVVSCKDGVFEIKEIKTRMLTYIFNSETECFERVLSDEEIDELANK